MVGTLIKTETNLGFFHGMIKDYQWDAHNDDIVLSVVWNDNDSTTEFFNNRKSDFDTSHYWFYDNGRWWEIDQNFHKFKNLLEGKCK